MWMMYPVELQERARLHFPYTTYYHVESVLQKRLKRQDHPLLIVSIFIYNSPKVCLWYLNYLCTLLLFVLYIFVVFVLLSWLNVSDTNTF